VRRALIALALLIATTGCSGHARELEGAGLGLDLPEGWTGEIYRRGADLVVLHAASFRLGPHDGYDPMGTIERGDRLVDARTGMSPRDVGVALYAYGDVPGPPFPKLDGPLQLRPSDRTGMEGFPAGHATYRRMFSAAGRDLEVIVEYGSEHPRPGLTARVARTLRTLTVGSD
jgi:hypothetical protein